MMGTPVTQGGSPHHRQCFGLSFPHQCPCHTNSEPSQAQSVAWCHSVSSPCADVTIPTPRCPHPNAGAGGHHSRPLFQGYTGLGGLYTESCRAKYPVILSLCCSPWGALQPLRSLSPSSHPSTYSTSSPLGCPVPPKHGGSPSPKSPATPTHPSVPSRPPLWHRELWTRLHPVPGTPPHSWGDAAQQTRPCLDPAPAAPAGPSPGSSW